MQLRHLASGVQTALDSGKANYKGLTWADDADAFAVLKGVEDKAYETKLYSVLGFTDLGKKPVKKVVYDPQSETSHVAVLDASAPERGPLARAHFDHAVPLTLHGSFVLDKACAAPQGLAGKLSLGVGGINACVISRPWR